MKTLAESLQNLSLEHHIAIDRCLDYLYSTRFYALELGSDELIKPIFAVVSDAMYVDDPMTRQSIKGFIFQLFSGLID